VAERPPARLTGGEPSPGAEAPEAHPGLYGLAITVVAVALTAVVVLLVTPLREAAGYAISGDTEALRAELDGIAGLGLLLFLAMLHSVFFYPSEILNAASGFVWGFWAGLGLVMVGWLLNASLSWEIGRHAARPLLHRAFGRDRFLRFEEAAERGGVFLLLAMRLIPIVPFSLFSIAAGAARVPIGRLLWTTAIGYLPITALFVYLGTQLEELSPTDPILIAGGVAMIAIVYAAHRWRRRPLSGEP
jgi:uncharacterized membrane protein YdjX (TVP38/TMEM64 family)